MVRLGGATVEVRGLEKTYGASTVVDGIDLNIAPGEFVTIVGPSGCGKSTVLEIVAGLRPSDGGDVLINDVSLNGPRQETGVIFQENSTLPWRTAIENVALSLEVRGAAKADRLRRSEVALATVGLADFARHYPAQLSGGMKQRVSLARVLTTEPDLILADEPFGALDEQTRLMVALELLAIVDRTSASVLFITHSIQEAVLLSDRVLIMSARPGRIIDEVVIDIPKPRTTELIGSSVMNRYTDRIW